MAVLLPSAGEDRFLPRNGALEVARGQRVARGAVTHFVDNLCVCGTNRAAAAEATTVVQEARAKPRHRVEALQSGVHVTRIA